MASYAHSFKVSFVQVKMAKKINDKQMWLSSHLGLANYWEDREEGTNAMEHLKIAFETVGALCS